MERDEAQKIGLKYMSDETYLHFRMEYNLPKGFDVNVLK